MTMDEMQKLKREYGEDMEITQAVHLHDEDEWNKYTISYRGVIVGSELVSADFVRDYIKSKWGNTITLSPGCKEWLEYQATKYGVDINEIIYSLWTMVDEEGIDLDEYII